MFRIIATVSVIVVCIFSQSARAQIQSVTAGGNWWEDTTWAGSQIPGAADDVIVNGPVAMRGGDTCLDLTITAGGGISDAPGGASVETVTINGRLENRGSIEGNLEINVLGDLFNTGTWVPWKTNLSGTASQVLTTEGGAAFGGSIVVNNGTGPVSAGSDLAFSQGSLDLRGHDLAIDGWTLVLDETATVYGGRIVGDFLLGGTFPARTGLSMVGTVTVIGSLVDWVGGGATETLRVQGLMVNQGTVQDGVGRLYIEMDGEIRNHGVWTANHTRFVGGGSQALSHELGHALGGTWSLADSSMISAGDTLVFEEATVDLLNGELQMNGLPLSLENGTLLQWGAVDTRELTVTGGSIIKGSRWLGDVTLHGNVQAGSSTLFEGSITVVDTLRDAPGGGAIEAVEVLGSVTNQGVIQGNMDLAVGSNLFNEGEWSNWTTLLTGRGRRTITGEKYETALHVAGDEVILTGEVYVNSIVVRSDASGRITGGASLHLPGGGLTGYVDNLTNFGRVVMHSPLPTNLITPFYQCSVVSNAPMDFDTLYVATYGSQVPQTYGSAVHNWWRFEPSSETSMVLSRATFYYSEAQLAGNDEGSLEVYYSPDGGNIWTQISTPTNVVRNVAEKTVTIEDVPANGDFVLSSNANPVASVPNVVVSVTGRNNIRIGAPSRYLVSYVNSSAIPSGDLLMSVQLDASAHILSVEMLDYAGAVIETMMPEDLVVEDVVGDSVALFWVEGLDPFEERSMFVVAMADPDGPGKVQTVEVFLTATVLYVLVGSWIVDYIRDLGTSACSNILDEIREAGVSDAEVQLAFKKAVIKTKDKWSSPGRPIEATKAFLLTELCKLTPLKAYCEAEPWVKAAGDCFVDMINTIVEVGWHRQINCPLSIVVQRLGGEAAGCPRGSSAWRWLAKVLSWDPNEKTGPGGYGVEQFVSSLGRIHYTILFENKAEATAPAYRIVIHDTLGAEVDPTSVAFGPNSHEGFTVSQSGNILTWDIEGIELPPNVNPPEGEGFVSFSVDPVEGLASGSALENRATIVFDMNPPITTNTFVNTLDFMGPVTTMTSLPPQVEGNEVVVHWESVDPNNGSGVKLANVYASLNGGSFWRVGQTTGDSLAVPIDSSGTYSFYAMGVDQVGNVEPSGPLPVTTNVIMVGLDDESLPYHFELLQNYPNPFNPETIVNYTLPTMGHVQMDVFDVTGRLVVRLVDDVQAPGHHSATWNARAMASGVYFYRLKQGGRADVKPMILIR